LIVQLPTLPALTSDRAVLRIAAWLEAALDLVALLFFPLLVVLPRGIAPLVSAAGLCGAGLVLATNAPKARSMLVPAAVLLGCLLLWGMVSALWSVDWMRALVMAARLAGLFAAGLALAAAASCVKSPGRLTLWLLAGFVLGVAMTAADLASHGALGAPFTDRVYKTERLNQASVTFAILLLPVTAALVRGRPAIYPLLFATATAAMIFALAGTAAKAALIAGLPIGVLLYLARDRVAHAAAVVSVLVIITAPLTFARFERISALAETADAFKLSAGHRLLIWSFAGDRIAERPLAGWGLDSARAIPGGKDLIRPTQSWMPLHPHNAALQLWLELGVPGAVLFALMIAYLWMALARAEWPRLYCAAAGASLAVALIASFGAYGIWQEWWLGTLAILLFLILVMARVEHPPSSPEL
jgi:O-antigen ligase